jgi:peptidoglycan/xylan/chitin deacetylase (PgdA/CDA1 family)
MVGLCLLVSSLVLAAPLAASDPGESSQARTTHSPFGWWPSVFEKFLSHHDHASVQAVSPIKKEPLTVILHSNASITHADSKPPVLNTAPNAKLPTTGPFSDGLLHPSLADVAEETYPALNASLKATVINQCIKPGMFAITFDDGPSKNMLPLLAELQRLKVKATFFVNCENQAHMSDPSSHDRNVLRLMYKRGHHIASHTYDHARLTTLTTAQIYREMSLNDDCIHRIINRRPIYMRAPYLSTNDAVLTALGSWGYKVVGINLDARDFEHSGKPNEIALNHASTDARIDNADPRQSSIISLDHDYVERIVEWTTELIERVRGKGFKIVTAAECLGDSKIYR